MNETQQWVRDVAQGFGAFREAFRPLGHFGLGLKSAMGDGFHRMRWQLAKPADYRRHRRRCRTCNPAGFARALPIDGHEYRRRLRNRGRRARR